MDYIITNGQEPRTFQKHSARESCITVRKRLALASILGPFGVHLLKFTPDTHPGLLMHYLGLLEFLVRVCDALQHTRDVPNLSDEYDCDLITGFPFALVFTCTFRPCVTYITKYMRLKGIIRNFGRLRAIL